MIEEVIKYQLNTDNLLPENIKRMKHILKEKLDRYKTNWGIRNELIYLWGLDIDEDTQPEERQ